MYNVKKFMRKVNIKFSTNFDPSIVTFFFFLRETASTRKQGEGQGRGGRENL